MEPFPWVMQLAAWSYLASVEPKDPGGAEKRTMTRHSALAVFGFGDV